MSEPQFPSPRTSNDMSSSAKFSPPIRMDYRLDDCLEATRGQVFLTGTQALVRLPLMQRALDRARGLNSAGFVSGYRGSPLGGYDQQLFAARKHLEQYNIKFQPGVNEDLAATAIWGSQQLNLL